MACSVAARPAAVLENSKIEETFLVIVAALSNLANLWLTCKPRKVREYDSLMLLGRIKRITHYNCVIDMSWACS